MELCATRAALELLVTAELGTGVTDDLTARDRLATLLPWAVYERVRTLPGIGKDASPWLGVVGQSDEGVTFWTDQDVVGWMQDPMLVPGLAAEEWDRFEAAWILLSDQPSRRVQVTVLGEFDSARTMVIVGAVGARKCDRRVGRSVSLTLGQGWLRCCSADGATDTWRRSP
ncbi:hypothetical protein GCM10009551_054340 [Nocardiopsis tropica]